MFATVGKCREGGKFEDIKQSLRNVSVLSDMTSKKGLTQDWYFAIEN